MSHRLDIAAIYSQHREAMVRQAVMLLHDDPDEARDVVSDVLASVAEGSVRLPSDAKCHRTYLLQAVRRRCLNHLEHMQVRERARKLYPIDTSLNDLADKLLTEERLTSIQRFISQNLAEQPRRIMEMRFREQMSVKAIADTLGITPAAIYKHIAHSICLLRTHLYHE